ncbi:hypothetical protein [Butyrivibrio sp. AC2005]|uniref:hypothetical protein n=1 Tax=Butyrivibrio sp. AC2005 TaxID=1280672 RepID=UPI00047C564C|nr:hypothetical protein [Butyrivibrio sp. AC2005]
MLNQDEYLEHSWLYEGNECFGLAMAYLLDTLSLSFDDAIWKELITISRDLEQVAIDMVAI